MTAEIGRWYRKTWPNGAVEYRMPYKVDLAKLRVVYRQLKCSGGCNAAAWRHWSQKAEAMPDGWQPPGWDGWQPKDSDQ